MQDYASTLRPTIERPWLFRKFSGVWLFKDHGVGRTQVIFRYSFQCRLGPAILIAHPLIARIFRRGGCTHTRAPGS